MASAAVRSKAVLLLLTNIESLLIVDPLILWFLFLVIILLCSVVSSFAIIYLENIELIYLL